MTDQMKAFWLGLFIIVALALLAWLILFLKPGVGDGAEMLKVRFSNIDRISEGSRVTFAGKPVGEVYEIREVAKAREAPADSGGNLYIYELLLKVDSSVKVFSYDEILYATTGLLGEKSIAIIPKAPPPGATPPKDMTHEILYAQSTDRFEQTLSQLTHVADHLGDALTQAGSFLEENKQDFNDLLKGLTLASHELRAFMSRANENDVPGKVSQAADRLVLAMTKAETFFTDIQSTQLVERMSSSFGSISEVTGLMATGQGTLGELAQSDCLYVQLTAVLCQLRIVLDDIRNYGVLYQFDRKWQRMHHAGKCN